jgi:hypothetical protein
MAGITAPTLAVRARPCNSRRPGHNTWTDARQDNDWGRIGDTREYLRGKLPEVQDRLRAFGAIPIDARQPLDQVVGAILPDTWASSGSSAL